MVLALAEISLEASRPESNLFRAYRISVGRDLFGKWTVATVNGRIDCKGQERVVQCATLAQAKRLVPLRSDSACPPLAGSAARTASSASSMPRRSCWRTPCTRCGAPAHHNARERCR